MFELLELLVLLVVEPHFSHTLVAEFQVYEYKLDEKQFDYPKALGSPIIHPEALVIQTDTEVSSNEYNGLQTDPLATVAHV